MNIKKNFKKISAVLLAAFMVLAMAIPAMADITATTNAPATDKAPISVSGLNPGDEVTFYQLMQITYNAEGQVMPEANWVFAEGLTDDQKTKLTTGAADGEDDINGLANGIKANTITSIASQTVAADTDGKAAIADVNAGTFIAIVTKASKVTDPEFGKDITPVYNPIMLSSGYKADGTYATDGKDISVGSKYGTNGTAKSSKPTVAKEITGGTTNDAAGGADEYDEDEWTSDSSAGKKTASLGETINYGVKIVVPAYPDGAVNKSLWMTDTFDPGVTFDGIETITVNTDYVVTDTVVEGYNTIEKDGTVLGWVKAGKNGNKDTFEIIFDYDVAKTLDSPLFVEYTGKLNENAEIGRRPNLNTVEYFYTTNPNNGGTYKPGKNKPNNDIASEDDQEAVYTYKVALIKTDANNNRLKDAEFVIKNAEGKYYNAETKAFDLTIEGYDYQDFVTAGAEIMKSDAKGLVEHSGLEKTGKYTFVEIKAPADYTLVEGTSKEVEATWATAKYTKWEKSYTTDVTKAENNTVVGKIKDGKFYPIGDANTPKDAVDAYLAKADTDITEATNPGTAVPAGIAKGELMNSKTPVLPSTGGIGTYIFTIIGVAIIAIAGFFIFRRRPQDDK